MRREPRRNGWRCAVFVATFVALPVLGRPPLAAADFTEPLRQALVRAHATCGSLRPDPLTQHAAEAALRSTVTYLDHNARVIPVEEPTAITPDQPSIMPILKDLGSSASRARLINGAGLTPADSIRSTLLIGYTYVADCGWKTFGVTTTDRTPSGYYLSSTVLADA